MKISKEYEKKDLPKLSQQIKDIVLAFDVNTNKTGYCFLINGKPVQIGQGDYRSIGTIKMVRQEKYLGQVAFNDKTPLEREKNKEYKNYGDRLFWGSGKSIQAIGSIVGDMFKQINPYYSKPLDTRPKIYIVFEISEIPQKRGSKNYQSITNVRKLSLYVGAIVQQLFITLDLTGYFVALETTTEVKLIKPTEWQTRLWIKKGSTEETKATSIEFANRKLNMWGLEQTNDDDMADSINIATLAKEVRDNLFVSTFNINKKELVYKSLPRDIYILKGKINALETEATKKQHNHLLKIKESKNSKFDYNTEKLKHTLTFLSKSQYDKWIKLNKTIKEKQELLTKMKGKVYDTSKFKNN